MYQYYYSITCGGNIFLISEAYLKVFHATIFCRFIEKYRYFYYAVRKIRMHIFRTIQIRETEKDLLHVFFKGLFICVRKRWIYNACFWKLWHLMCNVRRNRDSTPTVVTVNYVILIIIIVKIKCLLSTIFGFFILLTNPIQTYL